MALGHLGQEVAQVPQQAVVDPGQLAEAKSEGAAKLALATLCGAQTHSIMTRKVCTCVTQQL